MVEVLGQALAREIPVPELGEWLRRCTETLRIRAAVIALTSDQVHGICRELRDDFGLEADGVLVDEVTSGAALPIAIRRADVLLSTEAHAAKVQSIGDDLKKTVIVTKVRPDLIIGEWVLLLRQPVYAVVATAAFGDMLRSFSPKCRELTTFACWCLEETIFQRFRTTLLHTSLRESEHSSAVFSSPDASCLPCARSRRKRLEGFWISSCAPTSTRCEAWGGRAQPPRTSVSIPTGLCRYSARYGAMDCMSFTSAEGSSLGRKS